MSATISSFENEPHATRCTMGAVRCFIDAGCCRIYGQGLDRGAKHSASLRCVVEWCSERARCRCGWARNETTGKLVYRAGTPLFLVFPLFYSDVLHRAPGVVLIRRGHRWCHESAQRSILYSTEVARPILPCYTVPTNSVTLRR